MPLYDYKCTKCEDIQADVFAKVEQRQLVCPKCGSDSERMLPRPGNVNVFKAGFYEHIAEEPIYCGSKADLRAACRQNQSYSDYAW